MGSQTVNLQATASIPIDRDFWAEDHGWNAYLPIVLHPDALEFQTVRPDATAKHH